MIGIKINNKPLDTFDNESIQVTSRAKDFTDLSKIYASFSSEFVLPASDNNNAVFQNYWDFNIQEVNVMSQSYIDFRLKQRCSLEIAGVPYKTGFIKLNAIDFHDNKPSQYRVVFYDSLVQLTDTLGESLVSELNWSDLNHEIGNPAAVQIGLGATSVLYGNKVIYPLITNSKQEWTADRLLNGVIYNDDNYHSNRMIKSQELSPALQMYEIIKRIGDENNITFNAPIFDTAWFKKMYMWCPIRPDEKDLELIDDHGTNLLAPKENVTREDNVYYYTKYSETLGGVYQGNWHTMTYTITITPDAAFSTDPYVVRVLYREVMETKFMIPANNPQVTTKTGTQTFTFTINASDGLGNNPKWVSLWLHPVNSVQDFKFNFNVEVDFDVPNSKVTYHEDGLKWSDPKSDFSLAIPKVQQIDMLRAFIKMFNLVLIPRADGSLDFIPYEEWLDNGKVIDITDKLDIDKSTIQVLTLPKSVNFEWKEPKAENNAKFLELTGEAYGDEHLTTVGDGKDYDVKIDVTENLLWDRLDPPADNLYIGKAVSGGTVDSLTGINEPLFMYWSQGTTPITPIKLQRQSNSHNDITEYKMCDSYYPTVNPLHTLNFGGENNAYTTIAAPEGVSLISKYYQKTMHTLLDRNIRKYLVSGVIQFPYNTQILLNDIVKIYDNYYRIESIDANILTSAISFVLYNIERKESAIVPFTVDTQLPVVGRLALDSTSFTTADLSWLAGSDNVGVTNYDIYVDNIYNKTVGNVLTGQVTGLQDNKEYTFTIKAKDAAGNISWVSNKAVGKTKLIDNDPPIIGALRCGKYEHDKINIHWTKAIDAGVGVDYYDIYKDNTKVATVQYPGLAWVDQPLASGENHTYKIKAIDKYGNESIFSNEIGCSTNDTVPPTVQNLTIEGVYDLLYNMDVDDNVDVVKVEMYVNGSIRGVYINQADGTPVTKGNINILSMWIQGDEFYPGITYEIYAIVYDEAGNASQESNHVTYLVPNNYQQRSNADAVGGDTIYGYDTYQEACVVTGTSGDNIFSKIDRNLIGYSVGEKFYNRSLLFTKHNPNYGPNYFKIFYDVTIGPPPGDFGFSDNYRRYAKYNMIKLGDNVGGQADIITSVTNPCPVLQKIVILGNSNMNSYNACAGGMYMTAYASSASLNIGDKIYLDKAGSSLINEHSGYSEFWLKIGTIVVKVDITSTIVSKGVCP